jgi:ABC-type oligopeptide transport system substrate-binding subunit
MGIDLQVKAFSIPVLFNRLVRPGEPFDLAVSAWAADYPDPDDFLDYLLVSGGGGAIPPFGDPAYVRKAAAAAKLAGPRRYLAYGALDADVARNDAPWIALDNQASYDFFSARMGCQVFNPVYGMDLAALCIRTKT